MAKDTQVHVKKELLDRSIVPDRNPHRGTVAHPASIIELSSSDSDSDSSSPGRDNARKKRRMAENAVLPVGFLDPLPQPLSEQLPLALPSTAAVNAVAAPIAKQFWKAGEYEEAVPSADWRYSNGDAFFCTFFFLLSILNVACVLCT